MAASNATVFEVRPTGSDTNGGFWTVGATGTDWSQQAAAQYSVTDGVTAGTTTITSATAAFGVDVVGNGVYVQGGTGSVTAGWYQIISRTNATTIVVDRSTGLTAGTGVTLHVGGCLATVTGLAAAMNSCNPGGGKHWVRGGTTYVQTAVAAFANSAINPAPFNKIMGYGTVRGDGGKATIQLSGSATGCISVTTAGNLFENFVLDCNSISGTTGFTGTVTGTCVVRKCVAKNFTVAGIGLASTSGVVTDCEVTGGGSGATAGISSTANLIARNWVHGNQCPGIIATSTQMILHNIVTGNTGASSDGIRIQGSPGPQCYANTIYGNGRNGILMTAATLMVNITLKNNLIVSNGGAGLTLSSSSIYADFNWDGNCYFNNTSGNRVNVDALVAAGAGSQDPYVNVLDVTLTADPFTNAASNDFSLNTTAGGGAAARGAGNPSAFPGGLTTGHIDFGAAQHADPIPPTVPSAAQVLLGVQFGQGGTQFTGTITLPVAANVRNGITYGPSLGSTGTVVLPDATDVVDGVGYGAGGTEFTGSFAGCDYPAVSDVRVGVTYDSGAETGTYDPFAPATSRALDLSGGWRIMDSPVTVNYRSKTSVNTWAAGVDVTYCQRNSVTKADIASNSKLLEKDSSVFHLWTQKLGGIVPKIGDILTHDGAKWDVTEVGMCDRDTNGVQRYRAIVLRSRGSQS